MGNMSKHDKQTTALANNLADIADELARRVELDILTHTPEQIKARSHRRIAFLTRNVKGTDNET